MLGNRRVVLTGTVSPFVDRDTLVKPYLNITGSSEDTLLTLYIAAAQQLVEDYCQRPIALRTCVEDIYDNPLDRRLVLTNTPIVAMTSIVDADGVTVNSSYYDVDLQTGIITLDADHGDFLGDYVVTYTCGYAAIPDPVKMAMLELVKQARNDKSRDQDVVIQQSTDTGMATYKGAVPGVQQAEKSMPGMPDSVVRWLKPYRRRFA